MKKKAIVQYVVTPKGRPHYYLRNYYLGFTSIKDWATKFVSLKVAKLAAKLVEKELRKDWPDCLPIVARKLQ